MTFFTHKKKRSSSGFLKLNISMPYMVLIRVIQHYFYNYLKAISFLTFNENDNLDFSPFNAFSTLTAF